MHGNTKHKNKYVPCQGVNAAGLLDCPMNRDFHDHGAAVAFASRHGFSHVAHVEDGRLTELETVHADDRGEK